MELPKKLHLTATQSLTVGFAAIIFVGGLLLMLPICNKEPGSITFLNALFTATSATCVTGLVVYDTFSQFTFWGQLVIILLIQVGGLGFMTMALFFPLVLGRKIGLRERSNLMEAVSSLQLGGVVRLVKRILLGTLLIEGCGAILLALCFIPRFGLLTGSWYGVFHSISAFCNAGFDLMGVLEPYTGLVPYADDVVVTGVIMLLIIVGGIGFIVWDDVVDNGLHIRRYTFHARVALLTTGILIVGGTLLFLISEQDTVLKDLTFGQQLLRALFQSVTPRTAGFNTIDIAALSESGSLLTILLMLVGAAPGSTGGGVKVTTMAVAMATVFSYMRGATDTNLLRRRIDPALVKRAFCAIAFYLTLAISGCYILTLTQNGMPLRDIFLECFSAIGTVGLSTGVTRQMVGLSRVVLILLMFVGRVGSLTVFMTVTEREEAHLRNPIEKIIVG
ncbi:MAG: TrkH family potassium uptake protein [Oscillospiraceae bacterium]